MLTLNTMSKLKAKQCLSKIIINNQYFSEVFNFIQIQLDIHYLLALNLA